MKEKLIHAMEKFDFIKNARYTILVSLIIIFAGIVSLIIKGGFSLGIDFAGGKNVRVKVDKSITVEAEKMRNVFEKMDVSPNITQIGDSADQEFFLSYQEENNATKKILEALNKELGQGKWSILGEDFVGPKIGKEFQKMAVQISVLSLFLIMMYIGFRFQLKFGVAACLSLFHDFMICLALVSLLNFKFDIPILAAILTIIGYSVNDTIVIFDRIREEGKGLQLEHNPTEYLKLINLSIVKTMSRTILTSLTVYIAAGVLVAFVGIELKPMAIILLLGFISGTYSTIFIAAPAIVLWEKIVSRKDKKNIKKKEA